MELRELFSFLREKKRILIVVGIIAFLASTLLVIFIPVSYNSSAVVYTNRQYVTDSKISISSNENTSLLHDIQATNPVANLVYSDEMIKHLIERFDLAHHYIFKIMVYSTIFVLWVRFSNNLSVFKTSHEPVQ